MKVLLTLSSCFFCFLSYSQTANDLLGKWKLVKETKAGISSVPKDTYQVFADGGKFTGINGKKSRSGKWKLSEDGKKLHVSISIVSIDFEVLQFSEGKRVVSSPQTGLLEYIKVDE